MLNEWVIMMPYESHAAMIGKWTVGSMKHAQKILSAQPSLGVVVTAHLGASTGVDHSETAPILRDFI